MRTPETADRPSASRRLLLLVAAGAGLLLAGYVAAYVAVGPGIARGTTVLGVPIGGLSPEAAQSRLERELRQEVRADLVVRAGDATDRIRPARSGLALDTAATVEAAQARSWNPLELVDALVGGDQVVPVTVVDRAALRAAVDAVAERLDADVVEGAVTFDAKAQVVVTEPRAGVRVDRPGAVDAVAAAYLTPRHLRGDGRGVRLPAEVTDPAVSGAEVQRAAREVAGPAVAAPVQVSVEGTTVTLPVRAIARALTFAPDGTGTLQPALDGERLHAALADDLVGVEEPAKDASFDVSGARPRVIPSATGREVLPETLAAAVLPVLTATGGGRAVTVPLETSVPEVDTATAEGLGVTELVASYTTYYPSDFPPRLTNIHRAADLMDNTLVLPGEVFSFNETVGERTAERGFAAGFIIDNGRLEVDFGGGVSQLATTTFNAAFFAGLEIVEHNPHSFYISRYPEGRESTIAWGVKDLRVRNDSEHGIFLTTSYTNSSVTVKVWGTKRYRIEATKSPRFDVTPYRTVYDTRPPGTQPGNCVATDGVSGFKVVVTRLFYENGRQVRTEEFRTKYAPEHQVVCSPPPRPQPTPTPTPSPTASPSG